MIDRSRATERTALAWNRTGLAFVAAGAVVLRFLPADGRGAVGLAMVVVGTLTATHGWRYRAGTSPGRAVRLLALSTTTLAVGVLVAAALPT